MIKINTEHPIAYESPDHIMPWGTMRDNSTNEEFIAQTEHFFFPNTFNVLDIGCSGGQLIIDYHNRGHLAVGVEGSDYSVKHQRANWPEYHNKNLFTADATKPFSFILDDKDPIKFDLITAWELIEHIHPNDLNALFKNVYNNLKHDGIFVASISTKPDVIDGVVLHQSVFQQHEWSFDILTEDNAFKDTDLEWFVYPFSAAVRADGGSFHIGVKHKQTIDGGVNNDNNNDNNQ
jgi:SAM-dependent methyltransferase